jgi:hypothetical protein
MIRLLYSLFLISYSLFPGVSFAQRFGGNPPSTKWKQINTDTVRVIFQEGLEPQAHRVVNLTTHLNRNTAASIGNQTRKIDIVMQNQTTISNAYVGLAPWRSEFFMTPMQNSLQLGSISWTDNLSMHEYRHVQQYMNFRKGVSKWAYYILGEQGQGLANSMAVPDWFFEGDAVFQETGVSPQGRGRLPDFFNGYRSLWDAGKNYSYMKLRNGSMKDYVPNHYQLGYLMVAYGRLTYGPEFWKSVTQDAVRFKPFFYPFQGAIKKNSGVSFNKFVENAFSHVKLEINDTTEKDYGVQVTPKNTRYVTDYHFPHILGGDTTLVLKRSYRYIPAFYFLTSNGEHKIAVKDIGLDDYFAYKNGKLVYTVYKPHSRWSWKDYSGINIMDIHTGKRKRLTTGTKYFSPDISHDGQKIVAAEADPSGKSFLVILDANNGKVMQALPNPDQFFFTYPSFSKNDQEIFSAVRNPAGQMALMAFNISTGGQRILVPFTYKTIAFTRVRGDYVVFTASYNRKDQVWAWDNASGQLNLLTGHSTGSYEADLDLEKQELIYSRFTAEGMQLYREKTSSQQKLAVSDWENASNEVYAEEALKLKTVAGLQSVREIPAQAMPYKKGFRIFNFHSWRPWYEQPDWSLSIYSENVLNTFKSELYYQYNQNEGYSKFGFNGTFGGYYPWITGGLSYTFDRTFVGSPVDSVSTRSARWDEFNANAGLRLPLNFSGGRHYRFLTLSAILNDQSLFYKSTPSGKPDNRHFNYLQSSIAWNMQVQQAPQHIFPRFAHTVYLQERFAIGKTSANQFLASANVYLPGIIPTQNLVLNASYQARDTLGEYFFTNNFALARGYPGIDFPRMWKWGVNYHFTIAYPDWGFGQMLYFLRLRANIFYDNSSVKSLRTGIVTPLRSVGSEVYFDVRLWNQQAISLGFRYSRLLDADKYLDPINANQWEFIIPLNLIPR